MWITKSIIAHTLIWLVAFTIPMHNVATVSCGCKNAGECCQQDESSESCQRSEKHRGFSKTHACCQQPVIEPCRCTGASVCHCADTSPRKLDTGSRGTESRGTEAMASRSCCKSNKGGSYSAPACGCGANCQCGISKEPSPAAPPVENNSSPQKVVATSSDIECVATKNVPQVPRRPNRAAEDLNALAALDRCISLCRFTL